MPEAQEKCPLCGATTATPLLTAIDRACGGARTVDYGRCTDCTLVRQQPLPTPAEIPALYPPDYEPHEIVDPAGEQAKLGRSVNALAVRWHYGTTAPQRPWPARLVGRLLGTVTMPGTLAPRGECRLLDVGCGSGAWLYRHDLLGWQTAGVEPGPDAAQAARDLGLDVRTGGIDNAPTGPWDVIAFRHVIEHLPDPLAVVRRAGELLAPEGMILILTPNIESWGFARFGANWFPLEAPRHLCLWSPGTIRRLAREAGLRVDALVTEPQPKLLSRSRLYEHVWGEEDLELDAEERTGRAQRCRDELDNFLRGDKPWRKVMAPYIRWLAWRGRGETIQARLHR